MIKIVIDFFVYLQTMTGEPKKKFPKRGSKVRIGTGNTRVVMSVDSIAGRVKLRNPRNGAITTASARKILANQNGKKISFVERAHK